MKRIKLKSRNPNPLFELWLEEWREEAASKNSDLEYHFSKALASLRKYPLPLKSGRDCIILQHFGTKLCLMLDRKLKEYKIQNEDRDGNEFSYTNYYRNEEQVLKRKYKSQEAIADVNLLQERIELSDFDSLKLSEWSLENYAVLLMLYKKMLVACFSEHVIEADLLNEAKLLCKSVSKATVSNAFDNGLFSMIGGPIRYNLTEHGINLAKVICRVSGIEAKGINSCEVLKKIQAAVKVSLSTKTEPVKSLKNAKESSLKVPAFNTCSNDAASSGVSKALRFYKSKSAGYISNEKNVLQCDRILTPQNSQASNGHIQKDLGNQKKKKTSRNCAVNKLNDNKTDPSKSVQENVCLEPGRFDVILLVDTQEISGGKTKPEHDATIIELTELGVLFEIRHLKVGDFAWIARCRRTNIELILPYIVERKRIDDLSASITDGRFHEQKFRLKQCGIPNVIYIIEEYKRGQRLAIPHSSLMQASVNTLIQDKFSVKYTKTHKDSMFYLSSLTRILIKVYKDKNLISCKKEDIAKPDISSDICKLMIFTEFNKAASKQKVFQVSEMFIRHLLQLKGLSVEKAAAIVERYPTPRLLIEAFENCEAGKELLLANIQCGDKKRLVGPAISKTIYQLYTHKNLH